MLKNVNNAYAATANFSSSFTRPLTIASASPGRRAAHPKKGIGWMRNFRVKRQEELVTIPHQLICQPPKRKAQKPGQYPGWTQMLKKQLVIKYFPLLLAITGIVCYIYTLTITLVHEANPIKSTRKTR